MVRRRPNEARQSAGLPADVRRGLVALADRPGLRRTDRERLRALAAALPDDLRLRQSDAIVRLFGDLKDSARGAALRQLRQRANDAATAWLAERAAGPPDPSAPPVVRLVVVAPTGAGRNSPAESKYLLVELVADDGEAPPDPQLLSRAALHGQPRESRLYPPEEFVRPVLTERRDVVRDGSGGEHIPGALREALPRLRAEFDRLEALEDRRAAGLGFEKLLRELFDLGGLRPGRSIVRTGEQIDGSVLLDFETYLVEAKWCVAESVDPKELGFFREKVVRRGPAARGLLVSIHGFSGDALEWMREEEPRFFLVDGDDLRAVLHGRIAPDVLLRVKQRVLVESRRFLVSADEILATPELLAYGDPPLAPARRPLVQDVLRIAQTRGFDAVIVEGERDAPLAVIELRCFAAAEGTDAAGARISVGVWRESPVAPTEDALRDAVQRTGRSFQFLVVERLPVPSERIPDADEPTRRSKRGTRSRDRDRDDDQQDDPARTAPGERERARTPLPSLLLPQQVAAEMSAFARAVQAARTPYSRAAQYPSDRWIPPSLQAETGAAGDALGALLRWNDDDAAPPLAVLLGDYGVGKTFLAREFSRRVLDDHTRSRTARVPLYIDLRDVPPLRGRGDDRPASLDLEDFLGPWLRQSQFQRDDLPALVRAARAGYLLFVFDGFDEHASHMHPNDARFLWRTLASVAEGRARVLITCRTHFFESAEDERLRVRGEGARLARDPKLPTEARIHYLQPFDRKRIRAFLRKALGRRAATEFWTTIRTIHDLSNLASRPVLLNLLVELESDIRRLAAEGRRVGAGDVYETVVRNWLERDEGKHVLDPRDKAAFMESLAVALWREGRAELSVEELGDRLRTTLRDLFGATDPEKVRTSAADVRTATFLTRDGDGGYRFSHRSFHEFFLARVVARELRAGRADVLDLPRLSPETVGFALDLLFAPDRGGRVLAGGAARAVASVLEREDAPSPAKVNAAVLDVLWLRRSGAATTDTPRPAQTGATPEPPRPAARRLRGLLLAGLDLAGAPWAGADLRECDLDEANLEGADLFGADLRDARGRLTRLAGANLTGARFDDADFTTADFRRVTARGASFRDAVVRCAAFVDADLRAASFDGARLDGAGLLRTRCDTDPLRAARSIHAAGLPAFERRRFEFRCQAEFVESGNSVAFSPDGAHLASAGGDGTVRLWRVSDGAALRTLEGHRGSVLSVAFSPDGTLLASAGDDGTVRLWRVSDGAALRTVVAHGSLVRAVAFSSDGILLASAGDDGTVRLWRVADATALRTLEGHGNWVRSVVFSPDGTLLASGGDDGTVRLWRAADGAALRTIEGHSNWVLSVAFSRDGTILASAGYDGTVRLWRVFDGAALCTLVGRGRGILSVAFSPDGTRLASAGNDQTVRLWRAADWTALHSLEGHRRGVHSVAFSPDGTLLASAGNDQTVRLWRAGDGAALRAMEGHASAIVSVAFSPDAAVLISAGHDGTSRLWRAADGAVVRALEGHEGGVLAVAVSPDGALVASAGDDRTVRLWRTADGAAMRTLEGHNRRVNSVAFSPDGTVLASAGNGWTVDLWRAASGAALRTLEGHRGEVLSVAFSPDGTLIASAGGDWSVRLWRAADGAGLRTLAGHGGSVLSVAFSPDGTLLASAGGDRTVRLWRSVDGAAFRTLEGHGDDVCSIAFSRDGTVLVSAGNDGTVRLWRTADGAALRVLTLPAPPIWTLAVAPSEDRAAACVFAVARDRIVRIALDADVLGEAARADTSRTASVPMPRSARRAAMSRTAGAAPAVASPTPIPAPIEYEAFATPDGYVSLDRVHGLHGSPGWEKWVRIIDGLAVYEPRDLPELCRPGALGGGTPVEQPQRARRRRSAS